MDTCDKPVAGVGSYIREKNVQRFRPAEYPSLAVAHGSSLGGSRIDVFGRDPHGSCLL